VTVSAESFRAAGQFRASAVAIVASRDADGAPVGLAVAQVLPLSFDPPEVLVALNRMSQSCAPLLATGAFSVNFLDVSHEALCHRFGSPDGRAARFADPVWTELKTGMPVLRDALVSFDCRVRDSHVSGTHLLVTGSVIALQTGAGNRAPLIQYLGGYRRLVESDATV